MVSYCEILSKRIYINYAQTQKTLIQNRNIIWMIIYVENLRKRIITA